MTATELKMLACFGVEPQLLDAGVPWCYNDAAYLVEVDGLSVSFAVAPGYRDVRLIVRRGEQRPDRHEAGQEPALFTVLLHPRDAKEILTPADH